MFINKLLLITLIQILEDSAFRGEVLSFYFLMKVIIFNDKDNLDGALNMLNRSYGEGNKRFWDFNKYIPFLFEKLKELEGFKDKDLKLTKTFFYTGRYNSKLLSKVVYDCKKKIFELDKLIRGEQDLLDEIKKTSIDPGVSSKIEDHVNKLKGIFELQKKEYSDKINKQKRNFNGQKGFIKKIDENVSIELRTTPLKQANCEVYQKGVDGKIITDLVNLAHTDAYDIAFLLGGDTDLIEAIKLVRNSLSKIIVVVACYDPGNDGRTNISDVKKECDYFINLHDHSKELYDLHEPLRQRE